jgi:hypothetical protein
VPSGLPAGTAYPKPPLCVVCKDSLEIKILRLQSVSSAGHDEKKMLEGVVLFLLSDSTYQLDAVPGGERQDVRAGDGLLARRLEPGLDLVNEFVPAQGQVQLRVLLSLPVGCVQQHRPVAALKKPLTRSSFW